MIGGFDDMAVPIARVDRSGAASIANRSAESNNLPPRGGRLSGKSRIELGGFIAISPGFGRSPHPGLRSRKEVVDPGGVAGGWRVNGADSRIEDSRNGAHWGVLNSAVL